MEDLFASAENDLKNNDAAAAAAKIREYLEKHENSPLNIAITGECGAGKSKFVNALRGINDADEGTENTSEVASYPYPDYPNVTLWDLPGIGSTGFTPNEYLEHVRFKTFDFFIVISAYRFRENDAKLAKEIQKMQKKFYFVRSKIDNDINAERRKKDFSEEKSLTQMRENCVQGLEGQGIKSPQVFLVSSFFPCLYDFPVLRDTFRRELPELRRHAVLLPSHNINLEIISNKKKGAFDTKIKYFMLLSAAVAAVPVPGLSAAVDLGLRVTVVRRWVPGFGLDKQSLMRLAASSRVPYTDLCAVIKSPWAGVKTGKTLIMRMFIRFTFTAALLAAKERLRSIPKFGIPAAMCLSFIMPYSSLAFVLDEVADDAQRVFDRALGFHTAD